MIDSFIIFVYIVTLKMLVEDKNSIKIRNLILSRLPNVKIVLFGSRALGNNVVTSDF